MNLDLLGKEVKAVAVNGIGTDEQKTVIGELGKFSYPCADIADSYYIISVQEGKERHIEVIPSTIEAIPEPIVVDQHALCFTAKEAIWLKELASVAVPFWNVGVYLNYLTHKMGDDSVTFLQKLGLVKKEITNETDEN